MHKSFKTISLILLLTLIITILLTGCQSDKKLEKIRLVEVTHSLFYTPMYIAMEQGFFEEEGLEIELIDGKGADKVMASLLSEDADIGFMGPEASIYVFNEGREDYAVNFAQLTQKDGSFLVGREPEPDFTWDQLKGKEVLGGRKGGMQNMTLEYVIKEQGLNIEEDFNMRRDVQFDVLSGAFAGGEGDYVTLFEPIASSLEKEGKGYVVASIGEEGGYIPYTCFSALKSKIEKDPEMIQSFTNALYKGMLWVQNHDLEEVCKAVKPYFLDTEDDILSKVVDRYKSLNSWKPDPVISKDGLEHLMDIMESAGELDTRPDYDSIVNTEFAEKAIKNIRLE